MRRKKKKKLTANSFSCFLAAFASPSPKMAVSTIYSSSLPRSLILENRFRISVSQQVLSFGMKRIQDTAIHHRYGVYCVDYRRFCANKSSDVNPADLEDSIEDESHKGESLTTSEILMRLKRYGISGVLAYGLLNTAYYLSTFLFVWLFVAPAPGKMGFLGAAERLLKVLAMVWAGSQVTKLLRAGGALALAPLVDRGLSWFTLKFKFESRGKAFVAIAAFCFGLALIVFFVLTLLWS